MNKLYNIGIKLRFSIAIIGGGIAGVSVAKQISQTCDAEIVIVDKHDIGNPPRSSAFTFRDTVEKYRLEKAVKRYYSKVGLYSFLGCKVTYELASPRLAVLDYTTACKEMLSSVRKSRVQVYSHTRAKRAKKDRGRIRVELEGVSGSTIECDLLIDASGASFFTANFFPFQVPRFFSHAYGFELDNCTIPNIFLDELSFFVGKSIGSGGGWFYPITNDKCRFGVAEIGSLPNFPQEILKKRYNFAKRCMHPFSRMIQGSSPCMKQAGSIPAEPVKNMVSDNVMRVGDAAGHATPHVMEGIRPSIDSGILCGMIASEAYRKQDFSESFLGKYEKLWQNQHRLQYLYLLSAAEIYFSQDDKNVERTINSLARKSCKISPKAYLKGLRGDVKFPFFLLGAPSLQRLKIFMRFLYHNVRWFLE